MLELTHAILSTGNTLLREAGRLFRPFGLTAVQFNVLNLLADAPGGVKAAELTAALVVDASSTTYVLDRMEERGWVVRRDDPDDRRAWRVRLTPAGRALHRRVHPVYLKALTSVYRGVTGMDQKAALALLATLQAAAPAAVEAALEEGTERARGGAA